MHGTHAVGRTVVAFVSFAVALCLPGVATAQNDTDPPSQPSEPGASGQPGRSVEIEIDVDGGSSNAGGGKVRVFRFDEQAEGRRENYIGVFTEPLSEPLAAQLSGLLAKGQGLLVTGVMPGSPAEKAGLKKHDVLATYDDQKLINTQQLRQLIVGDKPGRAVKLGVVRQAKLKSLDVTPAERAVRFLQPLGSPRFIPIPERLKQPGGDGNVKGIIIEKGTIRLPGGGIRIGPPSEKKPPEGEPGQANSKIDRRSVVITSQDGKQFTLEVAYSDSSGKTTRKTLSGTIEEIRKQLQQLPAGIRDEVGRSLDRVGGDRKEGRSFRFQLQPGIEGTRRRLQLRLQRPGENDAVRILELELGRDEAIGVDDLLKIEVLSDELKQLAPEIRQRVESTLRNTPLPGARVDVQKSQ